MRLPGLALLAALLVAGTTSASQAQGLCNYGWWGGAAPFPCGTYFPNGGTYVPPYFSLFPPVYYSYPVPRPYGYSPYAYPPGTPTPEVQVQAVEAKVMVNPFVPKKPEPAADQTADRSRTIINPYAAVVVAAE